MSNASVEKLLKVCGVIDAQGYTYGGQFYPREIAIISHSFRQSNLCNTCLTYKMMTPKERKSNNYVSNHLLGLSLCANYIKDKPFFNDDGEQTIVLLYEKIKTKRQDCVAIKNKEIIPILEKWNIPYIDLESFDCPKMELLKLIYKSNICHFHEREVPDEEKLICADQKVVCLWNWVKDYIKYKDF